MQRMVIKLENVGIAVRDLEATIAFFTDLGLTVIGRETVSGEWTDTAVGLDGNHANIAMLQTPDGHGRLELFEYIHPKAIESKPTIPNEIGMHRVAFSVDDIDKALEIAARHGCRPLRGVATYQDVYRLTYIRGPSGIIVMLAEELEKKRRPPSSPRGVARPAAIVRCWPTAAARVAATRAVLHGRRDAGSTAGPMLSAPHLGYRTSKS